MIKVDRFIASMLAGTVWAVAIMPTVTHAQASASDYTDAARYDLARQLTGKIMPHPGGTSPRRYIAIRNTYDPAGRLTRVEHGELASWQGEDIAPERWAGFTVTSQVDLTYDTSNRKIRETSSSGGVAFKAVHYSYDNQGQLLCTAERMDPGKWSGQTDACTPQLTGPNGPDRITRHEYGAAGQLLKVYKAYGTPLLQQVYAAYEYSPNGKRTSVTDANGNRAEMRYDGYDRQSAWYFPSKTTVGVASRDDYEAYEYDANGNRTILRKRDGRHRRC